jgi:molecular chaperone DnaJ
MPKNYYLILGVTASASADDLRAAFRRRSKELHPDISGSESGPFLELQEAYAVLSDPARRRDYDRSSELRRSRPQRGISAAETVRRGFGAATRQRQNRERAMRERSPFDMFASLSGEFDEMFAKLWNTQEFSTGLPSNRHFTVELVASPEEARLGGRVRVDVPIQMLCPECRGQGWQADTHCRRCAGSGALTLTQAHEVNYPSGLRDGYTVRVPLSAVDTERLDLVVVFRVGE